MSFKPQRLSSSSSLDGLKKRENSRHTRTQVSHHQHTCGYCEIRESLLTHLLYCYTPPQYIHVLSLSCLKWAEHGIRQCTIFVFFSFILFVRADIQTTTKKRTSQHHREERAERLWRLKVQPQEKRGGRSGPSGPICSLLKCLIFFWLPISCRCCCCCTWQHIPTRLLFIIFFVFHGAATIVGGCCSGNEKNGHTRNRRQKPKETKQTGGIFIILARAQEKKWVQTCIYFYSLLLLQFFLLNKKNYRTNTELRKPSLFFSSLVSQSARIQNQLNCR